MTAQCLNIQTYLRGGGTLEELACTLAIRHARHPVYTSLILLKYDQINSPMENEIVQECRGLILDEAEDWRVVARAYDKFFNYGEPNAPEIHWESACVQEKVDGTLCIFYHYDNVWHVATTGTPDAGGRVHNGERIFRDLIWETAQQYELQLLSPEHSYLFELTSPYNRVVVPHAQPRLTLLGIRHAASGEWVALKHAQQYMSGSVPAVQEFTFATLEVLLSSLDNINPLEQEGYVVVDGAGTRVKIKHPRYVALHLLKSAFNLRAYVEVLRAGETPELLTYFPEIGVEYAPVRAAYEELAEEIDADFARLKPLATQKEFAQAALPTRCSAALFAMRAGDCRDARDYMGRRATVASIMRLLGLKEEAQITDTGAEGRE